MNKTIRIEKIYEKPFEWVGCEKCKKKVCEHNLPKKKYTGVNRTALAEGVYYKLKGWGANTIEEGSEITGGVEEETYTKKDGTSGSSYVITIQKPLGMVVEDVKKIVQYLSRDEFNQLVDQLLPMFAEDDKQEVSVDDIPF